VSGQLHAQAASPQVNRENKRMRERMNTRRKRKTKERRIKERRKESDIM
jgi:hypothetical protein